MPFFADAPILRALMYEEGLATLRYELQFTIINARAFFRQWWNDCL